MRFENIESDASLFYNKAKESFADCIQNKDNAFLRDEVNIPLEDIVVTEKDIKIVFQKRVFDEYIIEVRLLLLEDSRSIGEYVYTENDKREWIDDSLVFY